MDELIFIKRRIMEDGTECGVYLSDGMILECPIVDGVANGIGLRFLPNFKDNRLEGKYMIVNGLFTGKYIKYGYSKNTKNETTQYKLESGNYLNNQLHGVLKRYRHYWAYETHKLIYKCEYKCGVIHGSEEYYFINNLGESKSVISRNYYEGEKHGIERLKTTLNDTYLLVEYVHGDKIFEVLNNNNNKTKKTEVFHYTKYGDINIGYCRDTGNVVFQDYPDLNQYSIESWIEAFDVTKDKIKDKYVELFTDKRYYIAFVKLMSEYGVLV